MRWLNMPPIHSLGGSTEPFLPDQPSMSLFQSRDEVPAFKFSSYWTSEVTNILWGNNVEDMRKIIRFKLCHDDLPRSILRSRDKGTVEGFLLDLVTQEQAPFMAELSQNEQVEEIIRHSRLGVVSDPFFEWGWFPIQGRDSGHQAIARAIDAESHFQFTRIPFEEWVRYSLGYHPVAPVDWFLQQHTIFYIHLLEYLKGFPGEIRKYIEVGKVRLKILVSVFDEAN